ncbi:MAG: hypothetical protein JNK73_03980 [Bacteroidia bacterium]|nr:hypothetical protein [Bacteroidia bacterium]
MTTGHINKFNILAIYLTSLVLTDTGVGFSQTKTTENFYTTTGILISDSSFIISKNQLLKWRLVEDTVVKKIHSTIEYPMMMLEAGISLKFIYSFKVDRRGNPIDINFEKYGQASSQMMPLTYLFPQADTSIKKQIGQLNGLLKPLFNSRQPDSRYYLPYKFETFELKQDQDKVKTSFKISLGWMVFVHPTPFYEEPYRQIEAPKGVTCTVLEQPIKAIPNQKKKRNNR